MKRILLLLAIFCAITANAQNYLISFTGSGDTTTVTTLKVENLTTGTPPLTLNGSDILHLTTATGVNSIEDNQSSELKIYPNPMTDNSTLEIFPPVAGNAVITVLDMTGKPVAQIQSYLENYLQKFLLSGIKNGFYLINVKGNNYQFSGKLLSNGKSYGTISIEKVNNSIQSVDEKTEKTESKGVQATVDMAYSTGDRLKFTGISGNYSTVITDIPVSDKIINFKFIACTDVDANNYPVVQIGTQTWMAENLKTTRYRNGVSIGTTTPYNKDILGETNPKYQWAYEGNESNVATYGRYYTWHAVTDSRNVCPTGWYLPSYIEIFTFNNYLITSGFNYDGTISQVKYAKALASTTLWIADAGTGNVGNTDYSAKRNSTGFTALPGGFRDYDGKFSPIGLNGFWWITNEVNSDNAYSLVLNNNRSDVGTNNSNKKYGYSVRCMKAN